MWDGFFGNIVNNIQTGLSGAIATLTTSHQPAPPPPHVEILQTNLVNQELLAKIPLAKIPSAVDPEIARAFNDAEQRKMRLFSNLIANPNQYPHLPESDKIFVTQDVIQDLKRLGKTHTKPIDLIITRISGAENDSVIDEYEAIVISNYYVGLNKTTEEQIPVAIEKSPSFQCQRGDAPRNGGAGGGDTSGRRSQNTSTPPSVLFPDSRTSGDRTPAQLQRSAEMRNGMHAHILNTRKAEKNHPAGLRPITNSSQQNQPQTPLTGQGARDAVLTRGIRPTEFQSGDTTKAKERNLENIGKKLAKLEFELSRTKIRKGNLNIVAYRPEYGSHSQRRSEEYRDEGSNIKKDIDTLNKSLLKNYSLSDIKKVYTSKNTELQRLKNTPSVRPTAPLVATQPSRGDLTMI